MLGPNNRNVEEQKKDLLRLLESPKTVLIGRTAQRDISVLPVDAPLTVQQLLDLMKVFIEKCGVSQETMDSGEKVFVFRFIEIPDLNGENIKLYVKAKFVQTGERLFIFAAHPDRKW